MRPYAALAFDFDGTLADDQATLNDPATVAMLQRLRDAGYKLILNTGRTLEYLIGPQGIEDPAVVRLFDAVVAECGGTLWLPRESAAPAPLGPLHSPLLVNEMRRVGIPATMIWPGLASVATMRHLRPKASKALRRVNVDLRAAAQPPLNVRPVYNGESVTYLPAGTDKGSGLRAAAAALGISARQVIGFGDGENDLPFLRACGVAVAVANARPVLLAGLRHHLHAVLATRPAGAGVREICTQLLQGVLPPGNAIGGLE